MYVFWDDVMPTYVYQMLVLHFLSYHLFQQEFITAIDIWYDTVNYFIAINEVLTYLQIIQWKQTETLGYGE